MNWETGSEGPLLVSARVTRTRGKLLVEQRITNTGLTPLSQLELRLLYDHGELRPHGLDRVAVSHLQPGDSHSEEMWLEPRHEVQDLPLALRVRASDPAGASAECRLELGLFSYHLHGRPYSGPVRGALRVERALSRDAH